MARNVNGQKLWGKFPSQIKQYSAPLGHVVNKAASFRNIQQLFSIKYMLELKHVYNQQSLSHEKHRILLINPRAWALNLRHFCFETRFQNECNYFLPGVISF